ncbi:MAG: DUF222 domain-containing protein [Mycobacterium sp.]
MSVMAVREAVEGLRVALADCDVQAMTHTEVFAVLDELETLSCQLPTHWHRGLARLQTDTSSQQWGAKSWRDVLTVRWRLSPTEASRRLTEAAVLGPRRTLIGEPLEPLLPATAAAQELGVITAEHVTALRKAMARMPGFLDPATHAQVEVDLVRTAAGASPKDVTDHAALTLFLLDQDGPEPTDEQRQRTRGMSMSAQRRDGNSTISGELTPEARATWEVLFAKYAAPGMCNPADPEPCTSGTPSQEQIDNDHRSLAQRQHDALIAVGRIALMNHLGKLNGLPVSIIIRTTLQDLESRAGIGVTGGGTRLPITDVLRLAAHAHHHLAVFDRATGAALDLFRSKRIASPAQRIMLIARDGGCTKPGCTVGAYGSQVHHATADWHHGGLTNVDDLALACGPDNRLVDTHGGWSTRINDHHDVEWIPPEHLDTGQTRTNTIHTPEKHLRPPEDPRPNGDNETRDHRTHPGENRPDPDPATPSNTNDPSEPDEPGEPGEPGEPDEPGGPEPPPRIGATR